MLIKKFNGAYLEKINSSLKFVKGNSEILLKENQLLIKILYSGVCRSQIMEQKGYRDNQKYLPHLLGHEGSGTVIAKGSNVKKFKINDQVIITWIKCKGEQSEGNFLKINNKKINYGLVTTFSNYSIISENRLVKKPKKMSFKEAALFGCALSTGCGMVLNYNKKIKDKILVILGCGGIGLSILLILTCMKLNKNIYVLDKNQKKLKQLKFFFKTIKTFSSVDKLKFHLFKKHKKLADICFESAGSIKTIEQGFDLLNQKGNLIFASHPKKDQKIRLDPHQLISGKTILGSWGGDCDPDKDVPKIYKIIKKVLKKLINKFCKVYKLKDINKAFEDLNKNKTFRPLIKMEY